MATDEPTKDLYAKRYGQGGRPPEVDFLRAYASTYDDARQAFLGSIYTPADPALAVKYRELIAAAIIAVRGFPSVEHHLRRALKEGASVRECVEAMIVAAVPGGFRTLIFALGYLAKLAEELGLEPDPADGAGMEADGGETLDERLGFDSPEFAWVRAWYPEYDDRRRDFLSFVLAPTGNEALPTRYRELIYSAIVAFRGHSSTGPHLRRALVEGADIREVIEAMQVAGVPGGLPTFEYALSHLIPIAAELGIEPPAARS